MRLHDTATRSVRQFLPRGEEVTLYVCGITPYASAHLGHAFTYHTFDVLTRRLRSLGHRVRSVRNVTDVDDDIMRVSRERGIGWQELRDEQVASFDRQMDLIGLLPVSSAPYASAHVPDMIGWISKLVERGSAYTVDGWAYFDIATDADYGMLSRLDEPAMIALSRERGANPEDPRKRHPLDFVLWQPSLPDEPSWDTPWGAGRPGWHIECSVLAVNELGAPVDIHGGGEDLIYPHHECEIAQAAGNGITTFARHWMHVRFVSYKGEKMSKSLGNLVFVDDLLRRAPAPAVRLMLASHHYRQGWEYTDSDLEAACVRWRNYEDAMSADGRLNRERAEQLRSRFLDRIDEDLDTPGALAVADMIAMAVQEAARRGEAGHGSVSGGELLDELLELVGATSREREGVVGGL